MGIWHKSQALASSLLLTIIMNIYGKMLTLTLMHIYAKNNK